MSFEIFHERLPWQPKLPCNFHKNFIYVIRTLSLILLWKISFLAQRVHVSEILRHFSQFYPTHSRLVYDPTGMILAVLYGDVPHMLHAKYQPNPPGGSGEEDFWRVFTIFGHGGHLEFPIKTILAIFRSPKAWMLHMKFGYRYIWPSGFRGEVVWKCGRTTEAYHTISSPGAFGSGELKMKMTKLLPLKMHPLTLSASMQQKAAVNFTITILKILWSTVSTVNVFHLCKEC